MFTKAQQQYVTSGTCLWLPWRVRSLLVMRYEPIQLELFSGATEGSRPLATERDFGVILSIEGVTYPAQTFRSPMNDEQWRQFDKKLRDCNVTHDSAGYRNGTSIRSLVHQLYQNLVEVSPVLREFLGRTGEPRRLVIQTTRPELHLLP